MDVSNTKETLKDRSFSSQKYLQQFQENLTPAAFRFSQGKAIKIYFDTKVIFSPMGRKRNSYLSRSVANAATSV